MSFLPAADLKKKFHTEGAFYQTELNGESFTCRGLAKISRKGIETDVTDALFVMVNPGSCQPVNEAYQYPYFTGNLQEAPLVPAKSDPTQYQIMRLMERENWNIIYIINLSDLRAGNINDFKGYLKLFDAQNNNTHSIFSTERIDEIATLLSKNTKIIAGWGTQPFMKKKMQHALSVFSEYGKVFGLPHKTSPYYYHPYPMIQHKCIKWLDDMCVQLEGADRLERKEFKLKKENIQFT